MLSLILVFLIILWLLGYLQIPLTAIALFTLGRRPITLNDLLVFLVIIWLIDLLPHPFQEIGFVLLLLWVLSAVGIIAIAGLPNIVLIAIIVGVIAYIVGFAH